MKKELYQAMVNRLREITNENTQECVFKDLGLWKPEILNEVSNLSDKRPAIFIEFLPIIGRLPAVVYRMEMYRYDCISSALNLPNWKTVCNYWIWQKR